MLDKGVNKREIFRTSQEQNLCRNIFHTADTTGMQSIPHIKASSISDIFPVSKENGELLAPDSNVPTYSNQWLEEFQILKSSPSQPVLLSHNLNYNCYGDCFTLWLQVALWGGSDTGVKWSF